jgi:hypothetical protein
MVTLSFKNLLVITRRRMSKQNYDVLMKILEKISQETPKKGLAGGMPNDKEEEENV